MARNTTLGGSSNSSATKLRAVTPHASTALPEGPCRALYIGGAGNISVLADGDTDPVTFMGVAAGAILPVRAKAVRVANTTATNIVALY